MPPSRETAVIHGMDHVQGNGGGTSIAKILQAIRYPIQREPQFLGEEIRHETVGLMEVDHIHIFDPHIQDFNISFIRNKLTALLDNNEILTTSSMHALKVGEPIGSFYMIKWKGIYQSDDEIPAKIYDQGVRAGDCIYEDVDGNDVIDEKRQTSLSARLIQSSPVVSITHSSTKALT